MSMPKEQDTFGSHMQRHEEENKSEFSVLSEHSNEESGGDEKKRSTKV